MPTLSLFDDLAFPDGWHRVAAPGGYETWQFDAQSHDERLRLFAILMQGGVFHPQYARRSTAYLARPTRCRPPLPADYPCLLLALHEDGRLISRTMAQYAPGQFEGSPANCQVAIGPNRLQCRDGELHLHVEALTASQRRSSVSAELVFRPRFSHAPVQEEIFRLPPNLARHHWIVAHPLCDVDGEIQIPFKTGHRIVRLRGHGYRDHLYGSGPMGTTVRRWICGRILLPAQSLAFQLAQPIQPDVPVQAHVVIADDQGIRVAAAPLAAPGRPRRTRWGLSYPTALDVDMGLLLRRPRVIDSSPAYARLKYDAYVNGQLATAICQVVSPRRFGGPILGRLIERQIARYDEF